MSNQRGSLLVLTYLVATLMSVWVAIVFRQSATELRSAEQHVETLQAFYLAEGGVEDAYQWMRGQGAPPSGINPFDPFNGHQPMTRGRFQVTIDPDDNNPARYLDLFTMTATGEVNGTQVTRRVAQWLSTQSFARYSYFTNKELLPPSNTPIWFTTRDHLEGPIHSNDQLNIAGSPVFDGPVASAASSINYKTPPPAGGNNPQFNQGLALGASTIQLPQNVTQLRVAASSGGAWYTGNTTITLMPNGTMLVTNPVLRWVNQPQPLPANGAIFVNGGNVTVSGTLNGQLSIGTNRDLIIPSSIRCADDPQANPQSDDILGLVAEQNVVIAQAAPSNVTIQATVMALNTSFAVENWWQGPPKGTLSVYGGIIQSQRGPVGSFSSATGNKLSGYSKDYRYDPRLSSLAPPFYPTSGVYEPVFWQEQD